MTEEQAKRIDSIARRFRARWEAQAQEAERRSGVTLKAIALIEQGFTLIPSQHLQSNEVVVSEEVYKAAKEVLELASRLATGEFVFTVVDSGRIECD